MKVVKGVLTTFFKRWARLSLAGLLSSSSSSDCNLFFSVTEFFRFFFLIRAEANEVDLLHALSLLFFPLLCFSLAECSAFNTNGAFALCLVFLGATKFFPDLAPGV